MNRIDLFSICALYSKIEPLRSFPIYERATDGRHILDDAARALTEMYSSPYFQLRLSQDGAEKLKDQINVVTDKWYDKPEEGDEINDQLMWSLNELRKIAKAFFPVLESELKDLHTYFLPDVGLNSIHRLMEADLSAFSSAIHSKFPDAAMYDFREAGRCLALGLRTACGFHSLRANEATIKAYMLAISIPQHEIDGCKSWYDYANKIRSKDALIAGAVENMRVAYRNPIMHPEDTLDEEGADLLFQSCRSLMRVMAKHLPSIP